MVETTTLFDSGKMPCPFCQGKQTRVKDSRGSTTRSGVKVIRRRRKCLDCEARYSTLEIAVESIKEELADIEALGGIDAIDAQLNAIQGQIQRLQDTLTAAKRLRSAASLQKTGT